MSRKRSDSNHSDSSSNTTTSGATDGHSNRLYNDRDHYEIIFKNDSRFFDTSLHLFKSYRKRDYVRIPTKTKREKSPFLHVPSLGQTTRSRSNGASTGRQKQIGFNSNQNVNVMPKSVNTINASQSKRNQDYLMSLRSDPGLGKLTNRSPMPSTISAGRPPVRPIQASLPPPATYDDDDDSDGPDIIITRL